MANTRAIVSDTNGNTLYVVDLTAQTILATFSPTSPGPIAVLPNATKAYITDTAGPAIYTLALPANTLGPAIVPPFSLNTLKASPDGSHVYGSSSGSGTVIPVATPSDVVGAGIVTGAGNVNGLAVNPSSSMLYAVTPFNGIYPIAIPANTVGAPFGAAALSFNNPGGMVIMPSGLRGYVGSGNSPAQIWPVDLVAQTVGSPISTAPATFTGNPFLLPDGTKIFAPDSGSNQVIVINTTTNLVVATVTLTPGGSSSISGGFDSAGTTFYDPDISGGHIWSINTTAFTLGPTYAIGGTPRFIAVVPVPKPVAPSYPGGLFIPKLFIPIKGKVTIPYTQDELTTNWLAIENWSKRWLPPAPNLFIPHKSSSTPSDLTANWVAIQIWANQVINAKAPYPPIIVPRKDSSDPFDLDISFLAVQNWANRLPGQ